MCEADTFDLAACLLAFFAPRCAIAAKVFTEQASALSERGLLAAALDYSREGDTLVVTKLVVECEAQRSKRASRLEVSQRLPPIFSTSE